MDWTHTLAIIASMAGILAGYAFLFDRRIGDLNKRIEDTNKRIDDLREDINRRIDKLEEEIKEIRMLLYKVLEIPHKEEK